MSLSLVVLLAEFDMTEYRFPFGICNGYGMLTGDAYSSGHMVPSHLGLAYFPLVKTNPFPELVLFSGLITPNIPRYFLDFALYDIVPNMDRRSGHDLKNFRKVFRSLSKLCNPVFHS